MEKELFMTNYTKDKYDLYNSHDTYLQKCMQIGLIAYALSSKQEQKKFKNLIFEGSVFF